MTNHSIHQFNLDVIALETRHQKRSHSTKKSASFPYASNPNYLPNPVDPLYQIENISDADHVQNLIEEAARLESQIAGDFDLDELVGKIEINTLGYVKNGLIAFKIKSLRLYKQTCRTFKQFCEEHLRLSTWQVNRNIRAAKVVMELVAYGFEVLPQCEAQCRALLAHCEDNIVAAWRSVTENLLTHQITAKTITNHLRPETEQTVPTEEKITVNRGLFNRIYTVALSMGTTIPELLEQIFQSKHDNCAKLARSFAAETAAGSLVNYYYEEKIQQWQNDLSNLVKGYQNEIDIG